MVPTARNYQDSINNKEFHQLVKKFAPKVSDYECDSLFVMLASERNPANVTIATNQADQQPLPVTELDSQFEKWFRQEDSLNTFMNARLTLQRFKDFKTKLDVWTQCERRRQREKKAIKRHTQKIREALEFANKEYTLENEYIQKCVVMFDNLQEELCRL